MAYGGYRGQCVGRIIHFLYKMNPNIGENCFIGDGTVSADSYGKDLIATFKWNNDGDGDFPIFEFTEKWSEWDNKMRDISHQIHLKELSSGIQPYSKQEEQCLKEEKEQQWREKIRKQIMESGNV